MQSGDIQLPKLKIRQIEIRTHAHATESIDKVINCLIRIFKFEKTGIIIDNCSGSFGQRITTMKVQLKIQKDINEFLINLIGLIPNDNKKILNNSFSQRLDEKYKFYFRLDKQLIMMNKFKLSNSADTIQIIIAVQNKNPKVSLSEELVRIFFRELEIL